MSNYSFKLIIPPPLQCQYSHIQHQPKQPYTTPHPLHIGIQHRVALYSNVLPVLRDKVIELAKCCWDKPKILLLQPYSK